jgi:hypothetical protein
MNVSQSDGRVRARSATVKVTPRDGKGLGVA